MIERPRDRTTVLVGWVTVALMVIIAAIYVVVAQPWDPKRPPGRTSTTQTTSPAPQ